MTVSAPGVAPRMAGAARRTHLLTVAQQDPAQCRVPGRDDGLFAHMADGPASGAFDGVAF